MSKLIHFCNGIFGHWQFGPLITNEVASSGKRHEVMSSLFVPRWSQTDSSNGAWSHVVGVFLMSLNIASKFEVDVFVVLQMFPSEKILCR
jgi:hypothetical protein